MLPAFRVDGLEKLPVNSPVQAVVETAPFGFGYAFRNGAIPAGAEQEGTLVVMYGTVIS
jgi:hypothetical protein